MNDQNRKIPNDTQPSYIEEILHSILVNFSAEKSIAISKNSDSPNLKNPAFMCAYCLQSRWNKSFLKLMEKRTKGPRKAEDSSRSRQCPGSAASVLSSVQWVVFSPVQSIPQEEGVAQQPWKVGHGVKNQSCCQWLCELGKWLEPSVPLFLLQKTLMIGHLPRRFV